MLGGSFYVPPAGTFVRVATGSYHACGVRTSGEVECWGQGTTAPSGSSCDLGECGQSIPPPGTFIEIAAGYDSTCGLRPDFTIECWGNVSEPGPPCGQFVQMDVWNGGCAVGGDGHGQCWADSAQLDDVKQVSLGVACDCYLHTNNQADCSLYRNSVTSPPYSYIDRWPVSGVTAVACGANHACAILEDGTLTCTLPPFGLPHPPSGTFTELSCGVDYCCGMHTDGTAACFDYETGASTADMPANFPKGP